MLAVGAGLYDLGRGIDEAVIPGDALQADVGCLRRILIFTNHFPEPVVFKRQLFILPRKGKIASDLLGEPPGLCHESVGKPHCPQPLHAVVVVQHNNCRGLQQNENRSA